MTKHKAYYLCGTAALLAIAGCATSAASKSEVSYETHETLIEDVVVTDYTGNSAGVLNTTELFSERDLTNTPDLSEAVYMTLTSSENITISDAGVYVISGSGENITIYVDADDSAKVQIVLDGVTITNADQPAVYVNNADKVFVTTVLDSYLSVTGTFSENAVGNKTLDAMIYSKDDLVLNGTSTLTITSTSKGVKSNDDLKITGGSYVITAEDTAVSAHDSIRIAGGTLQLTAGTDGLHAEDNDDDSVGYIYIGGGDLTISAGDDSIHATTVFQMDGGSVNITKAAEGIEATYVQINDGTIAIAASDDGINASQKSDSYQPTIQITGGTTTITTPAGDTDGVDSNGNFIMEGGTLILNCSGMSSVDYDGTGTLSGGTLIVNGETITDLSKVADTMGGFPNQGGAPGGPQAGGPGMNNGNKGI